MTPLVDLGYAAYSGRSLSPHCNGFLGVPYAEPPLADLRFRNPRPISTTTKTTHVIDASQYPLFAVQGGQGAEGGAGSEDCLKVDVYTPSDATPQSSYPVLAYIHGGGYQVGAPKNWPFDHWITPTRKIVVVSIYYRLSVIGFLSHPRLVESGLGDLNVGIQDQIQALRWIQANVSSFGGDPSKMSVSAGASSVQLQLVANGGANTHLFRAAIAQSVYRTPVFRPEQKLETFEALLKELRCPHPDLEGQMQWLRATNPVALVQAAGISSSSGGTMLHVWTPVIDGVLLSDAPTMLIQAGKFANIPVLLGATTDETVSSDHPFRQRMRIHYPTCPEDVVDRLEGISPDINLALGDAIYRSAVPLFADHFSKSWCYRFDQPTPGIDKVDHSADNWAMFNGTDTGPNATTTFRSFTPEQLAFADELISYWTSFVRDGDPNSSKRDGSPEWDACAQAQSIPRMVFKGTGSAMELVSKEERGRHDYWLQLANALQN